MLISYKIQKGAATLPEAAAIVNSDLFADPSVHPLLEM